MQSDGVPPECRSTFGSLNRGQGRREGRERWEAATNEQPEKGRVKADMSRSGVCGLVRTCFCARGRPGGRQGEAEEEGR
jgi:hypothetical protein